MFSTGENFVTKSQKWFFPISIGILETFSDESVAIYENLTISWKNFTEKRN